jgi:hypothetical protein
MSGLNRLGYRSLSVLWGMVVGYLLVASSPLTRIYAPIPLGPGALYGMVLLCGLALGAWHGGLRMPALSSLLSCAVGSLTLALVLVTPSFSPLVWNKDAFRMSALMPGAIAFGVLLLIQTGGLLVGAVVRIFGWIPGLDE